MLLKIIKTSDMKINVKTTVEVDIIQELNGLKFSDRWEHISSLLGSISINDIEGMYSNDRKIIRNFLMRQANRF